MQKTIDISGTMIWNTNKGVAVLPSYADTLSIIEETVRAMEDPSVTGVLYTINSDGGMVAGTQELADAISALSATKPTAAYILGTCCSAAYWAASATRRIFAIPSSKVGSIGAASQIKKPDDDYETFVSASSPLKMMTTPVTDDYRTYQQERINSIGAQFRDTIMANRPGVDETALDGRVFGAAEALSLGLIDGIAPLHEELDVLLTPNKQ